MRRWTRPSRPRRAAGKERVAGGLLGLRGYRRGGTGHTPRTAKQTVPAWSLGPYAWPLPSWVVRIRATLTVRFTMSVNYPARWDISYRYMGQPGRVIGRFAGPARIRDQARSATLEVERVSRPGSAQPWDHPQGVPEIVPSRAFHNGRTDLAPVRQPLQARRPVPRFPSGRAGPDRVAAR